jgi:two-component system, chemotaxis family, CheB/CheR fusion protein
MMADERNAIYMTDFRSNSNKRRAGKAAKPVADEDLFIIGIGASAGGLQALDALFSNIPQDSVSYVVVQHVASDHKSMMKELLQRNAHLQIHEIEHDMEVEVNKIYILTRRNQVTIRQGRLQLSDYEQGNSPNRTFDEFFSSLAAEKGPRSIAVVLSGTGSDGTEGIAAIKRAGGLVIVQDPATAKFEGMPNSAIASGAADFILPPEMMPDEIFNFVKVTPLTKKLTENITDQEESTFLELLQLVHDRTGIDFSNYKRPTIIRRITRRMAVLNISSLLSYLDYLHVHPEEVETLGKEFLINVTKFFRDEEAFQPLQEAVLPEITKHKKAHDQLRIWVAGCSSGEEAYSFAILVQEHLDRIKMELDVKIFASDIDRDALAFAGKGLYPASSLSHVSPERIDQFFLQEEGKYRVCQRIRKTVVFAPHNIITAPPFSKIDLVSCRNMLIYLNPLLQKKVLAKFHYALNVSGFLFLGSSESVGDMKNFVEVNKKWKIYRNVEEARALGLETFSNTSYTVRVASPALPTFSRDPGTRHLVQHNFAEILNESVLEDFGYAAVFVDENYDIIHALGDYNQFLNLPAKALSLNLLKMVPTDLSATLGALLRKAIKEKQKASARGVMVRHNDLMRRLNIMVKPFLPDKKVVQRFLLVLLHEDVAEEIVPIDQEQYRQDHSNDARVKDLEMELQHTKEDLQSVVEELETANEELQSTNEELLSSNEELQSTNEELQSLNEELHTINAEHQYKIKALVELDDDLNNYFRSTDVSQIFVDRKLMVRKYTPSATKQINLIESDIGRSLYQISDNLRYEHLIEDLRKVIISPTVIEKVVQDKAGRWYQMRILPYVTQEKQTDGAILIFQDITELRNLNALNRSVLDSSLNGIEAFRAIRNSKNQIVDFEIVLVNETAEQFLGCKAEELVGKRLLIEFPEARTDGTIERYAQVVETGKRELFESQAEHQGQPRWFRSVVVKNQDGCVLTFEDITGQKSAEMHLRESVSKFRQLIEAFPQMTWTNQADGKVTSYNQNWHKYTGLSFEESKGLGWQQVVHPEDLPSTTAKLQEALQNEASFEFENRYRRADGEYRWHLNRAVPIRNEQGKVTQWIGTATDIHDLKTVQHRLAAQNQIISSIMRNLPVILWRISAEGVVEQSVGSGLRRLGLQDNELLGQPLADCYPGMAAQVARALAGETLSFLTEVEVQGEPVYKQNYFFHDPDSGGAIGFCLDVTEQKQAEEEASYRNRILDSMLGNMPIALSIFDQEGTYLELKGLGLRNVGIADNALQGVNIHQQFPILSDYAKQILAGKQLNFVLPSIHVETGEQRFFQFFGFFDDQKACGILFSIDITDSVNFQEKLKEEKDFTETVLQNSIDGIVAFDRDTRITAWNKAMESFTGLSREQVLGQDIFDLFPEYRVNDEGQAVRDALEGKNTILHDHPFGIKFGLQECTTVPLMTDRQEVIGGLSIVHDVTERGRLEKERTELKLNQQKEVLNVILETQEQERRRIAEALHNGLGQILYAAKLQLEEAAPEKRNGQEKDTEKERETARKNLETLLNDAIRETRTISFEMMPVILEDFGLEVALRELCKRLSQSGLSLNCYVSGFKERLTPGLETALYRITQELINNIIKHARAEEGTIHLEHKRNKIKLTVEDNGTGFDEKEVTKLKKGIGLNSIMNRLKLIDGNMAIKSQPNRGTIVTLTIPIEKS